MVLAGEMGQQVGSSGLCKMLLHGQTERKNAMSFKLTCLFLVLVGLCFCFCLGFFFFLTCPEITKILQQSGIWASEHKCNREATLSLYKRFLS